MSLSIWAMVAYLAFIIVWNVVIKRNIGESMLLGFVVVCLFGGKDFFQILGTGIVDALQEQVVFAALAFIFMGFMLKELGLMEKQVEILNSVFGRVRGGAGYVSTVASALFGTISGSGSGNAAAVGSVTIPWMTRSNWKPEIAASLVAGNSGLGPSFPPSSSMFVLLGSAAVAPFVAADQLFIGLFCGGAWALLYRLIVVTIWIRIYGVDKVERADIQPFKAAIRQGWTSLFIYIGIAVPLLLTVGPGADWLTGRLGAETFESISIIVWIPVMILLACLMVGAKHLPRSAKSWNKLLDKVAPQYSLVGATLFFAFAAASALGELGLSEDLAVFMSRIEAPGLVVALAVGSLVVLLAAPLTSTATIAAVGGVAFTALTAAGAGPVPAAVAVLLFSATEGCSPPGAAPIYIVSGIAGVDPGKLFVRLILWFVIPTIILGSLVALGLLPIFSIA